MEIKDIVEMQVRLDEANGFPIRFPDLTARYGQVTKDLVGLMGEIGEFANVVKKINIKLDKPDQYELDLSVAEASLKEELIDTLIYIVRISAMLDVDLEQALVDKIRLNSTRYARLRRG